MVVFGRGRDHREQGAGVAHDKSRENHERAVGHGDRTDGCGDDIVGADETSDGVDARHHLVDQRGERAVLQAEEEELVQDRGGAARLQGVALERHVS